MINIFLKYTIIFLLSYMYIYSKDLNLNYVFLKNDIILIDKCNKQSWCSLKDKSGYVQRFNFIKINKFSYKALYINYKYKKISKLKYKKRLLKYMKNIIGFTNKNEKYNFEFGFVKVLRIEEFNNQVQITKSQQIKLKNTNKKIYKFIKKDKKILTFKNILKKSYLTSAKIQKLKIEQQILKETISHEKLGYLPDIEFIYNLNYLKKDIEKNNIAYSQYKNAFLIDTRFTLYDFGLRSTLLNTYKKDIQIKTLEICEQKIQISIRLLDIYVEIYKQRKTLKILNKLLSLYEKKYTMKTKLLKQGLISSLNTLNEENDILNLKNKINAENMKLQDNINKLYYETKILLLDNIILEKIHNKNEFNLNYFTVNKIRNKINTKQIQKVQNEIKFYEKNNIPKINIHYNNTFYNEYDDKIHTSFDYKKRDYSVGFRISWNFSTYFKSRFDKIKKQLEIKNHIISYNKYKKNFQTDISNKSLQLKEFDIFYKNQLKLLKNVQEAVKINERLYERGFEYKYKVLESKIKLLNITYSLTNRQIENEKNKKYLLLLLEKENLCTHL